VETIEYGPLAQLIGVWHGAKGMDIAPDPDGQEQNPFFETIVFEAAGDVTNAESQYLAIVRYHQVVSKQVNDKVFHNESGYWLWDAERQIVMQTLTIPRGVSLVAGGACSADSSVIEVSASANDPDWGIAQSPFMRDNAKTLSFTHSMTTRGDTLTYRETTVIDIYGQPFDHTDANELHRA
jgi:hypothetical protein